METRTVTFVRNYEMKHWRRAARATETHELEKALADNLEARGIVRAAVGDEKTLDGQPVLRSQPEQAVAAAPAEESKKETAKK